MKSFLKGLGRGLLFLLPVLIIGCSAFYFLNKSKVPAANAELAVSTDFEDDFELPEVTDLAEDAAPTDNYDLLDNSAPITDEANSNIESEYNVDLSSENQEEISSSHNPVTLSFIGDVLFTEYPLSRYDANGVSSLVSDELLTLMRDSDIFMINEEFPFSTQGEAMEDKQYTFRVDPYYVKIFQELGVDIATVANNHALDFGVNAFTDSLDTLDEAGISRVGGGRNLEEAKAPVIKEVGDYTIGFLGASRVIPVSSWAAGSLHPGMLTAYDSRILENSIHELKESCDYVAVYIHWGVEKDIYPQEYQRELARTMIDAGADMIIGSHPHVMQGFEFYNGKPIAYSLGNFLFSNSSNETVVYQITIGTDGSLTPSVVPCVRTNGQMQIRTEPQSYYDYLTGLSYEAEINEEGILIPSSQSHPVS